MADLSTMFKTTAFQLEGEVVLEPRPYLGMSQLGHECSRFLWYQFHWAFLDTTTKRMIRLWERGHREEPVIVADLEKIGIKVWGDQVEMVAGHGHIKGHCDGQCSGVIEAPKTTHLAEFKTMKESAYKSYLKLGLEKYSPVYWGQIHLYMSFLKLTRTLYIVVNKNDDSRDVRRFALNQGVADDLLRKGESIILAESPPERAFPSKTFFKCKWCSAKHLCWETAPMQKNCRTCTQSNIALEGKWECTMHNAAIPVDFQRKGCDLYVRQEHE